MDISVSAAKGHLTELVRRAEAGETVLLTRRGHVVAKIVSAGERRTTPRFRRDIIDQIVKAASAKISPGPDAAHSQDYLYDEFGAPK